MRALPRSILALITLIGCGTTPGTTTEDATSTTSAAATGTGSASASVTDPTSDPTSTATAGSGASNTSATDPTTGPTTTDPSGTTAGTTTTGTTTTGDTTVGTTGDTGGGEACVDDHRVVAFVANWEECPTPGQMAQWSHAVVAFAVSYTWTPNGNICDPSCTIGAVPGCNGKTLTELTSELHAAGVKVLLSFGGAGMGGLWEGTCGQMTKCWDACLDRADQVVDALTGLVVEHGLDGIDIDYEYCLNEPAYVDFVADLTTGLRAALDALPGGPKLLTHAPMDHELEAGDPYFAIVDEHAGAFDFLMPQYYNGGLSPFDPADLVAIEAHYRALVDGPFGGDASRVVFGYCIEPGCNPVATQPAALGVAQEVASWYPNDGGVFFWSHPYEADASFSTPFRQYYDRAFCGG